MSHTARLVPVAILTSPAQEHGRPARSPEYRIRGPRIDRESRLAAVPGAVVEEDVEQDEGVDVPGREDLLELGLRELAPFRAPFERHPLVGHGDVVLGEPPGSGDLGDVWEQEEAGNGYRERDDGVDDEQPLPPVIAAHAL
ncbi:hypothetical protein NPX13_g7512 [Xylaria arbuscula]|uniref:Uncharacterized protein n=1 Tax=Xylaria arbuscula TaxID=114810 RepID=A0A9W8NA72_9PEZI|nr:hypothetical protein NPX13_g7512 [Xylaria arbuscula]